MIKLVATDVDGTLLRSDGEVSERNRDAIRRAGEAGLIVAFVTGRPPRWLDPLVEMTGHTGMAVGANGAVLYDMASEQIVQAHTIDVDTMRAMAADLRAVFPGVRFAAEQGRDFRLEDGYLHDWQINPRFDRDGRPVPAPEVSDLQTITDRPAIKLLAKDRSADPVAFRAAAAEVAGDRVTVTHSSSKGMVEISAAGVTKATGLAELADLHGVGAHEVAAIGDMPNDIPMLLWAGHSFAVDNADPAVKLAAKEGTVSNDDDAVALLIDLALSTR